MLAGGGPFANGFVDGVGAAARFEQLLGGVSLDNTQSILFVSDYFHNVVRAVEISTATVTTLTGGGSAGGTALGHMDGLGTAALYNWPSSVSADPWGRLYIAEEKNNGIRVLRTCQAPIPTPSPSSTVTSSQTMSPTRTASATLTSSGTPPQTASATATGSGTPTSTQSRSLAPSGTSAATLSSSGTVTATLSPSGTLSATQSATATVSTTLSSTGTPAVTPSFTATGTPTFSQTQTPTKTRTASATYSSSGSAPATPLGSASPSASPACGAPSFRALPRFDLYGSLIGAGFAAPTENACMQFCCATPPCDAYAYQAGDLLTGGSAPCYLYTNVTALVPVSIMSSGMLIAAYS